MNTKVSIGKVEPKLALSGDDIRVGKDVIEILTAGMYVSPITIYREYVQNSADSIDHARDRNILSSGKRGKIKITIDHANRSVMISDNGCGIKKKDALSILLSIGASTKRGTGARGFRGVGRLSGLAYCQEIAFRAKAPGERTVTQVSWNCNLLRQRLSDGAFKGDLKDIIAEIVSVSHQDAQSIDDHFFEVHLKNVARLKNDILLNEEMIAHYLGQVAPVPFSPDFSFGSDIQRKLATIPHQRPVDLYVGDTQIFRPYRDKLAFTLTSHVLELRAVEFIEFPNVDGEIGALGWIAHHDYVRSIPPTLGVRGLRARSGNLQIGEANIFDESFKESRFNGWTVGEIHIVDPRIVPNARRDNFEVNHHYYNLLVQLGPCAAKISQHCRTSSVSRNAEQIVRNVIQEVERRLKHKKTVDRAELSRLKSSVARAHPKAKKIAVASVAKTLKSKLDRLDSLLLKLQPKRGTPVIAFDEASKLIAKSITNRSQAKLLIEKLRKLCG